MNEDYVKTLVIDDPDYRPGDLLPNGPATKRPNRQSSEPARQEEIIGADVLTDDLPSFDDTSWLT